MTHNRDGFGMHIRHTRHTLFADYFRRKSSNRPEAHRQCKQIGERNANACSVPHNVKLL
jgi:hypothetical protein